MADIQWKETQWNVGDAELTVVQGGSGSPLVVLHEELGHPGITNWHAAMAQSRTVMIPLHPGFGQTPRVEWVSNIRDLAGLYGRAFREAGVVPADVIGFSLGGWIAAEMAAGNAAQFNRLVLVAPFGIRPPEGVIADMFQVTAKAYHDSSVQDIQSTPEFAKLYGGEPSPSNSRRGKTRGPKARGWPGCRICTIPAWRRCSNAPSRSRRSSSGARTIRSLRRVRRRSTATRLPGRNWCCWIIAGTAPRSSRPTCSWQS